MFGPTTELPESDHVANVDIIGSIQESPSTEPLTVNQIFFATRKGMAKGFRGNKIIESIFGHDHQIAFDSSDCLESIGLTWSFDLRQSLATDHGIEMLYILNQKPEDPHTMSSNIQKVLYP